ncbi:hypothetical protein EDB89DRAFT_2240532, partial [Lactarius sanguifluus]
MLFSITRHWELWVRVTNRLDLGKLTGGVHEVHDDESEPERKVMSFGNDRSSYAFEHPGNSPGPERVVQSPSPTIRSPWVDIRPFQLVWNLLATPELLMRNSGTKAPFSEGRPPSASGVGRLVEDHDGRPRKAVGNGPCIDFQFTAIRRRGRQDGSKPEPEFPRKNYNKEIGGGRSTKPTYTIVLRSYSIARGSCGLRAGAVAAGASSGTEVSHSSPRSFPSDQESLFTDPQFHGLKIRFNHVLQLKKQPFNSGARAYYRQIGPALLSTVPAIQNCFYGTAFSTTLATILLYPSPEAWRQ